MRKLTQKQVGKRIVITKLSKSDAFEPRAKEDIYGKAFLVAGVIMDGKIARLKFHASDESKKDIKNSLEYHLFRIAKPPKRKK
jgi:hypothetical protein